MKTHLFKVAALIFVATTLVGFKKADFVKGDVQALSFEQKFQRRDGQKDFYNTFQHYSRRGPGIARSASAESAVNKSDGGKRDFVESDVFAIDIPKKLVYLLNNYRGLQVVSFEKGDTNPILVGRVAPTGNFPDKMFFDKKNDRLIVLERTEDYNNSRLLVYDVTDKKNPKLQADQTQNFKGRISAERFDVTTGTMYIIASEYHYYWYHRRGSNKQQRRQNKGFVYSFDIASPTVKLKQALPLSLPAAGYQDIQLSEVKVKNSYKYYVVATLRKGYQEQDDRLKGFWSTDSSYVEVIDISDPDLIQPALLTAVKGQIRERSQIQIRGNTLIIVSNFNTFWRTNAPSQIALESFELPTEDVYSRPVNDLQLAATEKLIEATLQSEGLAMGTAAYSDRRKELVDQQLRGKFFVKNFKVINGQGQVETVKRVFKPYANQEIVPNNPVGVNNVSLQDVRVDDKYLYAFWVPRNLKDPLEVFDISNPTKIKYLKRLAFKKGWVEKAIPFKFNGQHLVMGIGFDRQEGQRGRQLVGVLAHIQEHADPFRPGKMKVTADEIDFKVLDNSNTWNSLNFADKLFTIAFNKDGAGSILFPYSRYNKKADGTQEWEQGGLKFNFDMDRYSAGDGFFSPTVFQAQGKGYTKRVFNNPINNRDHAFSDRELAIFGQVGVIASNQRQTAVAYLELARNVRAYVEISKYLGVQVISDRDYSCYWRGCSNKQTTSELRLVSTKTPDAEKHQLKNTFTIKGFYKSHLMSPANGQLYVITADDWQKKLPLVRGEKQKFQYFTKYRAYAVKGAGVKATSMMVGSFDERRNLYSSNFRWGGFNPYYSQQMSLSELSDGTVVFSSGKTLKSIKGNSMQIHKMNCSLQNIDTFRDLSRKPGGNEKFAKPSINNIQYKVMGGKVYASYQFIQFNKKLDLLYSKNMIAPMTLNSAMAKCNQAINIPGTPVEMIGDTLITNDNWVRKFNTAKQYPDMQRTHNTLKISSGVAKIMSMIQPDNHYLRELKFAGDSVVSLIVKSSRGVHGNYTQSSELQSIKIANNSFMAPVTSKIDLHGSWGDIHSILPLASGKHLVFVSSYRKIYVLEFDGSDFEMKELAEIDHNGNQGLSASSIRPLGWGFYGSSISYNETDKTVQIAQGLFGVRTLKITK